MKYFYQVLLLILLCLSCALSAQDFDNYLPLRASGDLPVEFTKSSTERYEEERTSINNGSQQKERKLQDKFYLESSFTIDQLFLSGRVLFNDPIGAYISKVADEILKDDLRLRAKLRFYVIKSMSSNAFTTQRGAIFVTMGMLARVENEAQLAFILCHEIAHFKEGHVLKSYVQKSIIQEEKDKGKGRYKKTNEVEKLIQQSVYSQENERQADAIGLDLYLKTDYNTAAVPSVFDVLIREVDRSLRPLFSGYHEIFSKNSTASDWAVEIQTVDMAIKKKSESQFSRVEKSSGKKPHYLIEGIDVSQVDVSDEIDLSVRKPTKKSRQQPNLSSHPDANEREKLISPRLPEVPSGSLFLVSETEFSTIGNMARFELCNLLLANAIYFEAIHLTLVMLAEYPDSKYLQKTLVKSLYGYSQYHEQDKNQDPIYYYGSQPWTSRGLELFLEKRNRNEMHLIALAKMWDMLTENPEDVYCKQAILDQVLDLLEQYPDFSTIPEEEPLPYLILGRLMVVPDFVSIYEEARSKRERNEEWDTFLESKRGKRYKTRFYRKVMLKGYRLGIDRVVAFSPGFFRLDIRNKQKNPIEYIAAEEQQSMITDYLLKAGKDLDLEVSVLDSRSAKSSNQTEVFNDLSLLETWQSEKNLHDDIEMVVSSYGEIQDLVQKYGTPYFITTGVISIRDRVPWSRYSVYGLTFLPLVWPYVGYETLRHEEISIVYSLVYDMNKGELIAAPYNAIKAKIKNEMLYHSLYADLYQMKRKKRK